MCKISLPYCILRSELGWSEQVLVGLQNRQREIELPIHREAKRPELFFPILEDANNK